MSLLRAVAIISCLLAAVASSPVPSLGYGYGWPYGSYGGLYSPYSYGLGYSYSYPSVYSYGIKPFGYYPYYW